MIAATLYRGDVIENAHAAHVAVVDADGRLVHSLGDPYRVTLPRSAAKPAQALAVIETGALERFGFTDEDLALMCGSHSSEPRHIERARAMLAKAHASEDDLRCGGHPPISDAVYRDWIKRDFTPTAVCSNCSGKHAGMLAGARAMNAPLDGYHLPEHPLQTHVKRTLARALDLPDDAVQWAIDGCNLPTPAFALERLARLYMTIAAAPEGSPLARIHRAMTTHPELVAGEGRFCTLLMQAFGGALVGKTGADASYAIGVRPGQAAQRTLGIAVKVEDGNTSVLNAVVVHVLDLLGIGTQQQRDALAAYRNPATRNTMGVPTGRLDVNFTLHHHQQ
ncbi:asparaginase [Caballeronia insecticola]|uniref:L-asparaginase II n=1 Tax=Caballeronia insecticola TaxID=758793 RepID=R4WNT1_9BURK|nr:asparaginase [Caballeronia insecticola]BAN22550.1 L-asparaginase II [Caballeronia insecticola]